MKVSIQKSIRIGSKTLVDVLEETRTQTYEPGVGHFEIKIGDKKIDCYAEKGAIDALIAGDEVSIPTITDLIRGKHG